MSRILPLLFLGMVLYSCQSSLGEKGNWTQEYKQLVLTNQKEAIEMEVPSEQIDSTQVKAICDCVVKELEQKFEPLAIEKEKNQDEIAQIGKECARKVLVAVQE